MDSSSDEIIHQWGSYIRVYKEGRVERFFGTDKVPSSIDSADGVSTKDVLIVPETDVSARIFIPTATIDSGHKLPLLIYFHGGGFRVGSPFCATYHNYVASLVAAAGVVAVSVDYRLAPEYPIPACYEDSWAALKWVASHSNRKGPEEWIRDHANFDQVFLAGDSGGANISHDLAARAGIENLNGMTLSGLCLVHPYFGIKDTVDESWIFVSPTTSGLDDFRYNPAADSIRMASLGCTRVLICLAEKDVLRQRGLYYYETLRKSGWSGEVEIAETEGEGHVFHLFNPNCDNAEALLKKLASFINHS
ncbi:carboxylesterase [Salix suchowensis]|nr:carboxylesterase [Salix suchowensis]